MSCRLVFYRTRFDIAHRDVVADIQTHLSDLSSGNRSETFTLPTFVPTFSAFTLDFNLPIRDGNGVVVNPLAFDYARILSPTNQGGLGDLCYFVSWENVNAGTVRAEFQHDPWSLLAYDTVFRGRLSHGITAVPLLATRSLAVSPSSPTYASSWHPIGAEGSGAALVIWLAYAEGDKEEFVLLRSNYNVQNRTVRDLTANARAGFSDLTKVYLDATSEDALSLFERDITRIMGVWLLPEPLAPNPDTVRPYATVKNDMDTSGALFDLVSLQYCNPILTYEGTIPRGSTDISQIVEVGTNTHHVTVNGGTNDIYYRFVVTASNLGGLTVQMRVGDQTIDMTNAFAAKYAFNASAVVDFTERQQESIGVLSQITSTGTSIANTALLAAGAVTGGASAAFGIGASILGGALGVAQTLTDPNRPSEITKGDVELNLVGTTTSRVASPLRYRVWDCANARDVADAYARYGFEIDITDSVPLSENEGGTYTGHRFLRFREPPEINGSTAASPYQLELIRDILVRGVRVWYDGYLNW